MPAPVIEGMTMMTIVTAAAATAVIIRNMAKFQNCSIFLISRQFFQGFFQNDGDRCLSAPPPTLFSGLILRRLMP